MQIKCTYFYNKCNSKFYKQKFHLLTTMPGSKYYKIWVLTHSNCYSVVYNIHFGNTSVPFKLTLKQLYNYYALYLAAGIVRMKQYKFYWAQTNTIEGILENMFFQKIMRINRFHTINHIIHCDVDVMLLYHNQVSQRFCTSTTKVSIDDDK